MVATATAVLVATGLLVGLVSALTPFLPVEAYVLSVAATSTTGVALAAAVAAAVGQTGGKLVLFTSARGAGRSRWLAALRRRGAREVARSGAVPAPAGAPAGESAGATAGAPTGAPTPASPSADPAAATAGVGVVARTADAVPAPGLRARWSQRVRRANAAGLRLVGSRAGWPVVLTSGAVGLPPLLAVAFYAGASAMPLRSFATACLTGRSVRFAVLALVPGLF